MKLISINHTTSARINVFSKMTKREVIIRVIAGMGLSSACIADDQVLKCLSCNYQIKNSKTEVNFSQKALKHFGSQKHFDQAKWRLIENTKPIPPGEEFVRVEYEIPPTKW